MSCPWHMPYLPPLNPVPFRGSAGQSSCLWMCASCEYSKFCLLSLFFQNSVALQAIHVPSTVPFVLVDLWILEVPFSSFRSEEGRKIKLRFNVSPLTFGHYSSTQNCARSRNKILVECWTTLGSLPSPELMEKEPQIEEIHKLNEKR